jgi:hypothetical protein
LKQKIGLAGRRIEAGFRMGFLMKPASKTARIVIVIKLLHTAVWLFIVACILAVPIAAALHNFRLSALFAAIVLLECLVLSVNRFRCPLTDLAARFAPETSHNFDIYLPNWLARHNKTIFGTIFVVGGLFALAQWLLSMR